MRVLIIGGDGYLGWPTAMRLSSRGHDVCVVDNFSKRKIELEEGVEPLWPIATLHQRVAAWNDIGNNNLELRVGDLSDAKFTYHVLEDFAPDAIIHYGEQPSAPYSMQSRTAAHYTMSNNVLGNLNLLFAIASKCPESHLIKLGTMGEYGTPNIDIEEGYISITHNGRTEEALFPKKPHSFYHLSKVHDSNNIFFACRTWGLRCTDLNQGLVYGIDTRETLMHKDFNTSFHYDDIFGTVLNRFCVQAVKSIPLTVYGKGTQRRATLNIEDTLNCVELSLNNPARHGEYRVFNQFTECFGIHEMAERVVSAAKNLGIVAEIKPIQNPRTEMEEHYYNPKNDGLLGIGLRPIVLKEDFLVSMLEKIATRKESINDKVIYPRVKWKSK